LTVHEYRSLPRARQDGLLEETVGEELLLYDQESHTAHCLSPVAACVWRHCDGERDMTGLAELAGVSEDLVAEALHELREKDLIDAEPVLIQDRVPGESRREAIGRVARYGAAATAVPLVVSATAATPAMASSGPIVRCKSTEATNPPKTCCICNNEECSPTGLTNEQCNTFCAEKTRGGVKLWELHAECETIV
jgi:hypothetical protein